MTREEALKALKSAQPELRLRAARCLNRSAVKADISVLREVVAHETSRWVKASLLQVIEKLNGNAQQKSLPELVDEDTLIMEGVYNDAVEHTSKKLVHELRPRIGRLSFHLMNLHGEAELEAQAELGMITELLRTIDTLSQVAASPVLSDMDLAEVVEVAIQGELGATAVRILPSGPKPMPILADRGLVTTIICNAIRNAIEATTVPGVRTADVETVSLEDDGTSSSLPPDNDIVVSWGESDVDYYINVLDRGAGLPVGFDKAFEIGATQKEGHLGMGLAIVKQAASSLCGSVKLSPRDPAGTTFSLRWPK